MPLFLKLREKLSYSWVVVFTLAIATTILNGIRQTFGVFFKSIESEFSLTRATTSAVFSASMLINAGVAILAGWASDRYGPRTVIFLMGLITGLGLLLTSQTNAAWQLFITYSLLLSLGTGAIFIVAVSTVSKWFTERRGRAMGIIASAVGLGVIVFAPLATVLISYFDWRIAFIIIGVIAWFIVVPLSTLLRRTPGENGTLPDETIPGSIDTERKRIESEEDNIQSAGLSVIQALGTRNFWYILSIWVFQGFTVRLIMTHIVPHATDIGIPAVQAATILSVQGGAQIIGGMLMGFVCDRIGSKMSVIISALLRTSALAWLIFAQDLWTFYLFALVSGFSLGGLATSMIVLIGNAFGLRRIGSIMGMLAIGHAVGSAIGPAIGGLVFDITNSYFSAFLSAAVAMSLVAILAFLTRREAEMDVNR
ncbi:MFS transporter [Chloroflexota bacterium]